MNKNFTYLRIPKVTLSSVIGMPFFKWLYSSSKRSIFYFLLIYNVFAVSNTYAMGFDVPQETITIEGVVKDELGVPMVGVTVIEEGTYNGVQTNFDGNFTISVNEGATLLMSFVGYQTQIIEDISADTNPLEITMELDVSNLDEVVIVGYGEQKKESVVASISQIDGDDILKTGATTNVSESLQGLSPGVTVINSDGLPGKGAHDIQIRGVGTWANTYPLIIVDGIERDFNMIDPSEIETISILKDASATAVYGVRGANGVIMITTKRGKAGDPKFNFSSNFGFKSPTRNKETTDFITTMRMYNEAAANDRLWENQIPQSEIHAWEENIGQAGPYNPYFPQINWWDEIIKDFGFQQQYNLNVNGGTESMRYFGSMGYVKDGDIFNTAMSKNSDFDPDFGFERYNWRFNLDFDITKTTLFSINFAGNFRNRLQPFFGPSDNAVYSAIHTLPSNIFPIKYPDGEWGDSPSGGQNFIVLLNEGGQEIHKAYQGFYDAKLNQKLGFITKGLSVEAKIAFTSNSSYFSSKRRDRATQGNASLGSEVRYYRNYDITNPINMPDGSIEYPLISEIRWPTDTYQGGKPIQTTYDAFRGYSRKLFYQFSTNYKRNYGKHAVTGLALMNRQTTVNAGENPVFDFPTFREDWVGRVTYAYDSKYLLELNGAYSGSEKFAAGKRFGFFPSFALGWVISKEAFVKKLIGETLDLFKVRYSQGEMGSDLGAPRFAYTKIYSSGGNVPFGYNNRTNYGPLYQEGRAANPDQTWETSLKRNLGFELEVLDRRLAATLDLYTEDRTGILMTRRTIPAWFGANEPTGNIGEAKNRGYEFSLSWKDNVGTDFNYNIGGNISQFENRIVFYDDPRMQDEYIKHEGKPIRWDRQGPRVINSGYYQSLDDIYNYAAPGLGVSQGQLVPGDLMFVDYNADGIVDVQDQVVMKNQLYPRLTYGVNFGVNYKNFSLQARIYGVSKIGRNRGDRLVWDFLDGEIMAHPDVITRWTPETASTALKPSLHIGSNILHNNSISTFNYTEGDYVRLKNVEFSYTIKEDLETFGIERLQLYSNANNLFTWAKNDLGTDPEAFAGNTYPVVKRYNVGLRLTF
jgi:TonB-linked SusC/RagA family outer membrane protein